MGTVESSEAPRPRGWSEGSAGLANKVRLSVCVVLKEVC